VRMKAFAVCVVAVACVLLASPGGQAKPMPPVILGYAYGQECPAAGYEQQGDAWHMNTCNCTSFVAWALDANGQRVDWFRLGEMDAHNWPAVARASGIRSGTSPRVGAVAVWPHLSAPWGHVGYVFAVHAGGRFDVAEYNLRRRFLFDARYGVQSAGVTFVYVPRRAHPG
jgi:surface antigen